LGDCAAGKSSASTAFARRVSESGGKKSSGSVTATDASRGAIERPPASAASQIARTRRAPRKAGRGSPALGARGQRLRAARAFAPGRSAMPIWAGERDRSDSARPRLPGPGGHGYVGPPRASGAVPHGGRAGGGGADRGGAARGRGPRALAARDRGDGARLSGAARRARFALSPRGRRRAAVARVAPARPGAPVTHRPDALPVTIADAAAALRRRELSSQELTAAVLARADRLDPLLGTYLARFDETALAAAKQADADFAAGIDRGPLQGIPVGVKDILATLEGPTTAQSLVLDRAWGRGSD